MLEELNMYIKEHLHDTYEKLLKKDKDLDKILALSEIRNNLVNWYPFDKNREILQIGANYGEITEELSNKLKQVKVWEEDEDKREIIKLRLKNSKNVQILENSPVGKLQNKYDYIIFENVEEQSEKFEELIKWAKKVISLEGTILISVENKLGLRRLNGISLSKEEEVKKENRVTKREIEQILEKQGFNYVKFYYPLPNAKVPNIIFTDKHLPSQESIYRDLTLYDKEDIIGFEEREIYKQILQEDKTIFPIFANSFFVEISQKKIETNINYIVFGNSRKPEYRLKTIMKDDEVIKQEINQDSRVHLRQIGENIKILKDLGFYILDTMKEKEIHSKLVLEVKSFDKELTQISKTEGTAILIKNIKEFYQELETKLTPMELCEDNVFKKYNIEISSEMENELHFIKEGIFDLIFQNCFKMDNKFYFYDQEWFEKNIPLEFILYRSIWYLTQAEKSISREFLFENFNLIKYVPIFEKLESKLQEKVKDKVIWDIHANNYTVKNLYDTYINERNQKAIIERDKNEEIKKIIEQNQNQLKQLEELRNEMNYIKNSKSWKIIESMRLIRKKFKGEQ